MKKLFFFRTSADKQVCAENSSNGGLDNQRNTRDELSAQSLRTSLFKPQNHTSENQGPDPSIRLRRSQSFSSAAYKGNAMAQGNFSCFSDQSSSPSSSSSSVNAQQHIHSSRGRTRTPERHVKAKGFTKVPLENDHSRRKPPSHSSRRYHDHSGNASLGSSNVLNEVLDLYIDGEQDFERGGPVSKTSLKDHAQHVGKKPPRIQFTGPPSPTGSIKHNPRTHSFRAARGSEHYPSSRDWIETGFGCESPKALAKHVAEKLGQTHSRKKSRDFDYDVPTTIEDVYGRFFNKNGTSNPETAFLESGVPCNDHTSPNGPRASSGIHAEDEVDIELKSKFQEAKDRILFLSEELEQESFSRDMEFNVPSLIQRVRGLTEEKISLALELCAALESRLADRSSMKEQLRSLSLELESRTLKLQKEINDIEKELDRRSSDWSSKVEIFQAEEVRLRERVRELAEQNVYLQREVSSLTKMETDRNNMEKQVNDLTATLESYQGENEDLRQAILELQEKYKVADEDKVCLQRNYREKEEECKDLHMCVTRLLRTCSDQEKTIEGLRGELTDMVQEKHPMENLERHVQKLQLEQIRLTGVEQILRREFESYKIEVDSLRSENISLLNRLRSGGDGSGLLTLKIDEELCGRLDSLQGQGLSLLNESTKMCSKLLESLKSVSRSVGKESTEVFRNSLDAHFIMESDMKVQGFRRGIESLMRSLQNISTVMREKSDLSSNSHTKSMDDNAFGLQNGSNVKDFTRSELKAEVLLTSLYREKLYAKSQDIEQLQAEVATAARGNDVLRCEVQNALDSLSAASHRMKELELLMIKKDDKIQQLENELQESTKEVRKLPKVTEERDMMWEEVKQLAEKNMLWNSEVNLLKKKIETLDEELLLKEGEITILRDTLGSKSFDLLASPDRTHEFLL
ncbi:uncharacterized protein LOC141600020 [Silene latifolia]|uniref:uncharacterized protein LOC141600020 n=1 Tax=Silene latifolia TaxID=37657 RepID=UPI003D77B045